MQFDWDKNQAEPNLSKQPVSFEEAKTVFDDPLYVDFYDSEHSEDEDRYLFVGQSNRGQLLIVSYTERGNLIGLIRDLRINKLLSRLEKQLVTPTLNYGN
ncbi:MAG: BrnT family toxin [Microcystis aeruginosa Ma_MB_F_20061100_S20]|uniref:BrnT family toxin n=1 Tax=Microcystis aeruginosa Ma_MB_F_20061100_S20D TaxID=2486253 RepID=A0A552EEE2_MICAE|nr:MAG: BrnT family toxin [Microcystis aeruginosa Ma_MB_F_20061100_S20D]TRU41898.1 MAG: BrnT family toxin [Microcystis aeruginosa Ma_MB_F_20061100_S20]